MDKSMIDEAIKLLRDENICNGCEGKDTDDITDFVIQELTKIKSGEYVSRGELLYPYEITQIVSKIMEEEGYQPELVKTAPLIMKITEVLSGRLYKGEICEKCSSKIARPVIDRGKIVRIILNREYVPTVCEDSGQVEWSMGEVNKLADAILEELNK